MTQKKRILSISPDECKMLLGVLKEEGGRPGINISARKLELDREDYLFLVQAVAEERQRKIDAGEPWNVEAAFLTKLLQTREKRVRCR